MKAVTELFAIEGQGILVPDEDVTVTKTDVVGESLRDRNGTLHRSILRQGLTTWEFSYRVLTQQEREYMLGLLRRSPEFPFTHPEGVSMCYCKDISMDYHDASLGHWTNFRFRIEEV